MKGISVQERVQHILSELKIRLYVSETLSFSILFKATWKTAKGFGFSEAAYKEKRGGSRLLHCTVCLTEWKVFVISSDKHTFLKLDTVLTCPTLTPALCDAACCAYARVLPVVRDILSRLQIIYKETAGYSSLLRIQMLRWIKSHLHASNTSCDTKCSSCF